jgi:TRAP-type mannitol/chloroaromatic compound transport system permease large subunit
VIGLERLATSFCTINAAYYLKAVAPQWRLGDIYWGMAQFMVLQMVGLALCIMFPQIALWFPYWLFGK